MLIGPIAVVLAAVLIGAAWDVSGAEAGGSLALAAAGLAAAIVLAAASGWLAGRFLRGRALVLLPVAVAADYALLVFAFGWKAFLSGAVWIEMVPALGAFLEVAPAIAVDFVAARSAARARAGGDEPAAAVRLPRHYLIPLAPYIAFSALVDLRYWFPGIEEAIAVRDAVAIGLLLGALAVLVAFAPRLARLLFPAEPLPAGPLRDALLGIGVRAGVRIREIYVWHTGRLRIANACIAGILPHTRSVFLTDQLIGCLSPAQIEAVFAHELGHARGRHFTWYLAYAMAFLLVLVWLDGWPEIAGIHAGIRFGGLIVLLVLYWRVLFGWISRRMELEADALAIHLTGDPAAFAGALQVLDASSHGGRSWRHLSIPRRIALALREGAGAWRARKARVAIAVSVLVAAAAWVDIALRDARRPAWRSDLIVAELALGRAMRGRREELPRAIALACRALADGDPDSRAAAFEILAAAYASGGDPERAERAREEDRSLADEAPAAP
ncbi:MAG: M48 family metalloprotease [Planctomycetes bacterium]|nr:M48 family metalloprotease [Planctomycetota bacterium]